VVNPFFNPHLNSQREHLLLGTIIEAGSGSHLYSQRERLSLGTTIEEGLGSQSAPRFAKRTTLLGTLLGAVLGRLIRNPQYPHSFAETILEKERRITDIVPGLETFLRQKI
jgi:hypothetical protein